MKTEEKIFLSCHVSCEVTNVTVSLSLFSKTKSILPLSQSYYQVPTKLNLRTYKATGLTLTQLKEFKVKEPHKQSNLTLEMIGKNCGRLRKMLQVSTIRQEAKMDGRSST